MLQRQQAGAIIAARSRIVEGAVSMVADALNRLESEGVVTLDDERRATTFSNLLVVLCGESRATPSSRGIAAPATPAPLNPGTSAQGRRRPPDRRPGAGAITGRWPTRRR
ncbi:hypothetical protein GCM10027054_21350 [Isoptericola nanjingensis]